MDIDATFVGTVGQRDNNEVLKIMFVVRFKVLTAVLMKIPVAGYMTGCILVYRYHHLVAYLGFCPQGQVVTIVTPKRNYGI